VLTFLSRLKYYIILLWISSLLLSLLSELGIYFSPIKATTEESSCIKYDSSEEIISINCKGANLTGVYNQLKDPNLLRKDVDSEGVRFSKTIY
jgi:hypothetical protein